MEIHPHQKRLCRFGIATYSYPSLYHFSELPGEVFMFCLSFVIQKVQTTSFWDTGPCSSPPWAASADVARNSHPLFGVVENDMKTTELRHTLW